MYPLSPNAWLDDSHDIDGPIDRSVLERFEALQAALSSWRSCQPRPLVLEGSAI